MKRNCHSISCSLTLIVTHWGSEFPHHTPSLSRQDASLWWKMKPRRRWWRQPWGEQGRWGRILGVFSFRSVVQTNWDEFLTLGRKWGWATFQRLDFHISDRSLFFPSPPLFITSTLICFHVFCLISQSFPCHLSCIRIGACFYQLGTQWPMTQEDNLPVLLSYHCVSTHTRTHTYTCREHQVPLMQKSTACHTEQFRSNFRTCEDPWGQRRMRKPQMVKTFRSLKISSPLKLKQLWRNISHFYICHVPKCSHLSLSNFVSRLFSMWERLIHSIEQRYGPSGSKGRKCWTLTPPTFLYFIGSLLTPPGKSL